jgi:DMSO/TMAO reductase YedYZ molybdopterin-dependent catalytic subunit
MVNLSVMMLQTPFLRKVIVILCFITFLPLPPIFGQSAPSSVPAGEARLSINGNVERPLQLTPADLVKLSRHTERVKDHDGVDASFSGVALVEILRLAGVALGEQLRGKALTTYLLVKAADGYQVVFALPELDSGFTDRVIFLADQRDGKPLSAKEGPLRIIVPGEKRHARWVRQVTDLTVVHAGK